jgi:hypothetical protein
MACRPVEVRDGTVVLGFPESQLFLRDIAERKRSVLEDGLSGVLGQPSRALRGANVELPPASRRRCRQRAGRPRAAVFADDVLDVAEVE